MKKKLRLYLDTSVFGGYTEDIFKVDSKRVIDGIIDGRATLLASPILVGEIEAAPSHIENLYKKIPPHHVEVLEFNQEIVKLAQAYVQHKVLTKKSILDATHVATASVNRADAIISWNFKHIVRLDKIKGFTEVNLKLGYREIVILSPKEVQFYE